MALFYIPDITKTWELPEEEAAHCLRVLRLGVGDNLEATDGKGNFYKAVISSVSGKHCYIEAIEIIPTPKSWQGYLHLAIAPTKNIDRIEWFIEKAVEIGIDEVTFLNCRFSERKMVKTERIERIVISAMKQSLKPYKTIINEMTDFKKFIVKNADGERFIAHCYEEEKQQLKNILKAGSKATIMIGPEGDFSPEEVECAKKAGYTAVSLGNSRLRTETAGLVACHTFNIINEI